jgi:hypothetical protein
MTLRLIRDQSAYDPDSHWSAFSGELPIGTMHVQPGGAGRGRWQWFLFEIYEPGGAPWSGSEPTRDGAMHALGVRFRKWLDLAGLVETDDLTPRDGAPFTFEPSDERFWSVRTPSGFRVGHISKHLTVPELVWQEREVFWSGCITKFTARVPGPRLFWSDA